MGNELDEKNQALLTGREESVELPVAGGGITVTALLRAGGVILITSR